MTTTTTYTRPEGLPERPKRADAARNYDALIAAAKEAFTENGADASLEDIARRAGVGIGTLYRNFPTRQDLLEATYVEEVQAICAKAGAVEGAEPWDALDAWLREFAGYAITKKALASELTACMDSGSEVLAVCRGQLESAAEPLFEDAREAGAVRADANTMDILRMVAGIATIQNSSPEQIHRILDVALDGLRPR